MKKQRKRLTKKTTPTSVRDNKYFHEEVTYDSVKEQWPGLASLLLIPLFIFIMGFGFYSVFHLPNGGSDNSGFKVGVGGGPDVTFTPTPSIERPIKGENMDFIQ
jgi:hypothetical protein